MSHMILPCFHVLALGPRGSLDASGRLLTDTFRPAVDLCPLTQSLDGNEGA
ncbi:hypothetical protein GLOTRDRAFT_132922 [Gloeophyllum trabeum ATCC 11539]|uniref:Uncharacterized protein n=1 Tax=Gloeophyllum trabeum (strain ATCC 11539 / FP-39264 / Madison 617) TaxID=670483 RepID=S7RBF1_GLOTA|nr:uncharacterized protein GLOTRDRAFT_132922 [Gloeophyllum trabeum ATCC 11539]EPQ51555.1 hypothetical protein GLOTRDRAFT_132922 [Gloeophyllum trabeum ATCC 11539]